MLLFYSLIAYHSTYHGSTTLDDEFQREELSNVTVKIKREGRRNVCRSFHDFVSSMVLAGRIPFPSTRVLRRYSRISFQFVLVDPYLPT
jgi:hypothetical protein